MPQKDENISY